MGHLLVTPIMVILHSNHLHMSGRTIWAMARCCMWEDVTMARWLHMRGCDHGKVAAYGRMWLHMGGCESCDNGNTNRQFLIPILL